MVVAEASTGREAVEATRRTHADVVLMDIRMPGTDGLTATRIITSDETLAEVRILILTTFEIDEYVFAALRAGASGFLGKGAEQAEILDAIRTVARGESLLSPSPRPLSSPTSSPRRALAAVVSGTGSSRSPPGKGKCSRS